MKEHERNKLSELQREKEGGQGDRRYLQRACFNSKWKVINYSYSFYSPFNFSTKVLKFSFYNFRTLVL